MADKPRKSPEANPRFAREETTRLASSKKAVAVALNFVSAPAPNLPLQLLKPLAVSVRTAATLIGVGETTLWGLVGSGSELEVLRIGRRTLVTFASLERLVARLASSYDLEPEELVQSQVVDGRDAARLGRAPGVDDINPRAVNNDQGRPKKRKHLTRCSSSPPS
jgi:hypothetical protein